MKMASSPVPGKQVQTIPGSGLHLLSISGWVQKAALLVLPMNVAPQSHFWLHFYVTWDLPSNFTLVEQL